ncbi:MAG TPA: aldolase [Streptosporangiaceae bacterium]|jgi:hypothetical protein
MKSTLTSAGHADLRARVEAARADHDSGYPGPPIVWQPVHTVYVPADRVAADIGPAYGKEALALLDAHVRGTASFAEAFGVAVDLADEVRARVAAKLVADPVEDLRIDFEDGYGVRDDETEDADTERAADAVARAYTEGILPRRWGPRVKSFADGGYDRAVSTLDGLLTGVIDRVGALPPGFVITFPKVISSAHVAVFAGLLARLEAALGLEAGLLRFEVQVETPRTVLDRSGAATLPAVVEAAAGRMSAAHFGVFDYTAALGLPPEQQRLDHPACDFARNIMQVTLAGTGVETSDGATNLAPAGDETAAVHAVWQVHAAHVRHSLAHGFYQGWDMHPAHLVSRFATVYAFHLTGFADLAGRVRAWAENTTGASGVMDEPATVKALLARLRRAVGCGAVTEAEALSATGLDTLR